jgi:hypothetical protein
VRTRRRGRVGKERTWRQGIVVGKAALAFAQRGVEEPSVTFSMSITPTQERRLRELAERRKLGLVTMAREIVLRGLAPCERVCPAPSNLLRSDDEEESAVR